MIAEIDYSKGCARFNKDTCNCDLMVGECKHRDYKESLLLKEDRGPSEEEIDLAALQYATKMSAAPDKETPDWIMTDFKAGIAWLLRYQAACASGADCTVAEGEELLCFCANGGEERADGTCAFCSNKIARKSPEGQP